MVSSPRSLRRKSGAGKADTELVAIAEERGPQLIVHRTTVAEPLILEVEFRLQVFVAQATVDAS